MRRLPGSEGGWRVVMQDAGTQEVPPAVAPTGTETMHETVTITRAEYDRLRVAEQDFQDLCAALTARDRIEAGAEELVPAAVADRLIDGQSPLKVWREHRALSQSALARASGVTRVQIADIEAHRATCSARTLRALADVLRVTVDDLLPA